MRCVTWRKNSTPCICPQAALHPTEHQHLLYYTRAQRHFGSVRHATTKVRPACRCRCTRAWPRWVSRVWASQRRPRRRFALLDYLCPTLHPPKTPFSLAIHSSFKPWKPVPIPAIHLGIHRLVCWLICDVTKANGRLLADTSNTERASSTVLSTRLSRRLD